MNKLTLVFIGLLSFLALSGCQSSGTGQSSTASSPSSAPSAPQSPPTTPATPAQLVAQAESSTWFKSIRPTVATLGQVVINTATTAQDKHDKELIVYDASHSFWSLFGSGTIDPNAITAVVGGWLPSKPWWNAAVNGFALALTPIKNWIANTIQKYGGNTASVVTKVINDALNQAALGCEDCTASDLGFPIASAS